MLTWLLATAVATGVGFLAISTVGDVLRGAGPLGASFASPPATPEPSESRAVRAALATEHVQLVAECRGRVATLLEVEPLGRWQLRATEEGPDEDVEAVLARDGHQVRVEVYCNRGEPRLVLFG